MLLFVRKQYADAIRQGTKPFEIRAGSRYAKVKKGDLLSINGHFQVRVIKVDNHSRASILKALPDWTEAIESCYANHPGPYFVFHLEPEACR